MNGGVGEKEMIELREFHKHSGTTKCDNCLEPSNTYLIYIPLIGMWVCQRCHWKWDRWAFRLFKEMIGFE